MIKLVCIKTYTHYSPKNITVGKIYESFQWVSIQNSPLVDVSWVNIIDDTGFVKSHPKEYFKLLSEVRNDTLTQLLS